MEYLIYTGGIVALIAVAFGALLLAAIFRRVVPTNMVHIVQSTRKTTSYGKGKDAGNTYYAWPSWVPYFGVVVFEFPESIFSVPLNGYEAYDTNRLPFIVDVVAFFRVEDSGVAAQRVSSFSELEEQLTAVLQGSVRRILAMNTLEQIMEIRGELGQQFTNEVDLQARTEWGVRTVKTIEFMDLRDTPKSHVIANIMAKHQSRIDKESRTVVAENNRAAQLAEIEAAREVDLGTQQATQQVGERTATQERAVGIAKEQAKQEIASEAAVTAEKDMEVLRVKDTRAAEIAKQVEVTRAEAERQAVELRSQGVLAQTKNEAEGTLVTGEATAKAQELLLMAPVTAQITLAKEIGENAGYQTYLVTLRQVEAAEGVGKAMSVALEKADLKVISTNGEVAGGVAKLTDLFTPAGGTSLTGMLAALAQTPEGAAIAARLGGTKPASGPSAGADEGNPGPDSPPDEPTPPRGPRRIHT